jgi:hypothetical protein
VSCSSVQIPTSYMTTRVILEYELLPSYKKGPRGGGISYRRTEENIEESSVMSKTIVGPRPDPKAITVR